MEHEFYDVVREFKNNPMFAREFVHIHESFSLWQKFVIKMRYLIKTRLGI